MNLGKKTLQKRIIEILLCSNGREKNGRRWKFFSWNLCGCVKVRAVIIVYVKCIFFALASVDAKANRVLYVCERERKKRPKEKKSEWKRTGSAIRVTKPRLMYLNRCFKQKFNLKYCKIDFFPLKCSYPIKF